jgi:hypothetical protein
VKSLRRGVVAYAQWSSSMMVTVTSDTVSSVAPSEGFSS